MVKIVHPVTFNKPGQVRVDKDFRGQHPSAYEPAEGEATVLPFTLTDEPDEPDAPAPDPTADEAEKERVRAAVAELQREAAAALAVPGVELGKP